MKIHEVVDEIHRKLDIEGRKPYHGKQFNCIVYMNVDLYLECMAQPAREGRVDPCASEFFHYGTVRGFPVVLSHPFYVSGPAGGHRRTGPLFSVVVI